MWSFSDISRDETRSKSKLRDFFPDAGDAESLTREIGQNSLDAKQKGLNQPVSLKVTIGDIEKKETSWLFEGFDDHVDSVVEQTNPQFPIRVPDSFDYILIEDYNTTGFSGSFDNENEKEKGSLVSFWWEEGESDKPTGSGGSHGVGKVTLSEASQSGLFFANSIREEDSDEILFGYCRIGRHQFDEKTQREYARYGINDNSNKDDPFLRPYSVTSGESAHIEKFKAAFGIDRSVAGTSLVVPVIDTELVSYEKIVDTLLDNFYLPIMKGVFEVEISDRTSNKSISFNKTNFKNQALAIRANDTDYQERLELASSLLFDSGFYVTAVDFNFSSKESRIQELTFNQDRLAEMRSDYVLGVPVKVKLDVKLFPSNQEAEIGTLDIVIKRRVSGSDKSENHFYDAFRGDVLIQDEKMGSRKASAILDVYRADAEGRPNPLSEFMKYCEDPGHKNWRGAVNRRNERTHYKRGEDVWPKMLVRNAVKELVAILEELEDRKIDDFADDLFFFDEQKQIEVDLVEHDEDNDDEGYPAGGSSPDPEIQATSKPLVAITKAKNGIEIKSTQMMKDAVLSENQLSSIEVIFCYEMFGASKAKWKRNGISDILLEDDKKYSIEPKNAKVLNVKCNSFEILPLCQDFSVTVSGFDKNRQLYVDAKDRKLYRELFPRSSQ